MEAVIWPAKEYLQYSTIMLLYIIVSRMWYNTVINSEEERIAKNTVKEQCKYNLQQTFYSRVYSISKERSRYKSSRKTQEVSSMEEIDQAEDQGKYTKKTAMKWDKKQKEEQLKMIN